ncbi:MAG: cob(I)yrinic acid a,c-diamide adenosyltransferase [Bordetella sp.]|jgi:cob(I)alamin adenosyltransferase
MTEKNRLTRIVTRSGDDGHSGLADGGRLPKDHERFEAIGDVDELNSVLGMLRAEVQAAQVSTIDEVQAKGLFEADTLLESIQHDLFDLGGELAMPGHEVFQSERLLSLDESISEINAALPSLREFILPGGSRATGVCHLARTVARRAERRLVSLNRALAHAGQPTCRPSLQHYLNRLSDLLFVLSRQLNRLQGVTDICWRNRPRPTNASGLRRSSDG